MLTGEALVLGGHNDGVVIQGELSSSKAMHYETDFPRQICNTDAIPEIVVMGVECYKLVSICTHYYSPPVYNGGYFPGIGTYTYFYIPKDISHDQEGYYVINALWRSHVQLKRIRDEV